MNCENIILKLAQLFPENLIGTVTKLLTEVSNVGVIAGGSILYALTNTTELGDIDVFVNTPNDFYMILNMIYKYANDNCSDCSYSRLVNPDDKNKLSILNIKLTECSPIIQLIYKHFNDARHLIENFDLDYIQCCINKGVLHITNECITSQKTKTILKYKDPMIKHKRLCKALYKGFSTILLGEIDDGDFIIYFKEIEYLKIFDLELTGIVTYFDIKGRDTFYNISDIEITKIIVGNQCQINNPKVTYFPAYFQVCMGPYFKTITTASIEIDVVKKEDNKIIVNPNDPILKYFDLIKTGYVSTDKFKIGKNIVIFEPYAIKSDNKIKLRGLITPSYEKYDLLGVNFNHNVEIEYKGVEDFCKKSGLSFDKNTLEITHRTDSISIEIAKLKKLEISDEKYADAYNEMLSTYETYRYYKKKDKNKDNDKKDIVSSMKKACDEMVVSAISRFKIVPPFAGLYFIQEQKKIIDSIHDKKGMISFVNNLGEQIFPYC